MSDWAAWLMEGWAAGVAQRDPEAGGSLFATADSRFEQQLILPGRLHLTSVYPTLQINPDEVSGELPLIEPGDLVPDEATSALARSWTSPAIGMDVVDVWAYVRPPQAGQFLTLGMYTNVAGEPGVLLQSATVTGASDPAPGPRWVLFQFGSAVNPLALSLIHISEPTRPY